MKKIFVILLTLVIFFSCKKSQEVPEEKNIFGETIYTDSFSPSSWENPVARTKIEAEDKDIGKIIKENNLDQRYQKIFELVNNFLTFIQSKNNDEMQKIMTPSAYNTYILHYPEIPSDKKYQLRVAYPENVNADKYWIDFKILFQNSNIISKIEVEKNNRSFRISDIESKFFTDLDNALSGKAVKPKK